MSKKLAEKKWAELSPCGKYRYVLGRDWAGGSQERKRVLFVMLNPSTADHNLDDQTVRKCRGFAMEWRMNGFEAVNLFALRSTDKTELVRALYPVEHQAKANMRALQKRLSDGRIKIVCVAWGDEGWAGIVSRRAAMYREIIGRRAVCLRVLSDGISPMHPLMAAYGPFVNYRSPL